MQKETSAGLVGLNQDSTVATIQKRVSVQRGVNILEVPCYDQDAVYFQENRSLERESTDEVGSSLSRILDNVLVYGELVSLTSYHDVLHAVKKRKKEYAKTLGGEPNVVEKPEEFWQMLAELEQNIRTSTSNEEIENQEALSRFNGLLYGTCELISRSPWGAYLRWNELTINHQPVVEYLAPAIQKLKESGGKAFLLLLTEVFRTALE